jgi:hypothetical protein
MAAGRMGYSTTQDGDLVANALACGVAARRPARAGRLSACGS